jgi:hypothetical protein
VFRKDGVPTRFFERGFPIDFQIGDMPLLHYATLERSPGVAKEILVAGADSRATITLDAQMRANLQARNPGTEVPGQVTALQVARLLGADAVSHVIEAHNAQKVIEQVVANHRSINPS